MKIYLDEENVSKLTDHIIDKMYQAMETALALENQDVKESGINREIPLEQTAISLTMVSEEEIKDINREYRGIDKVTDVLSFPQFDNVYAELNPNDKAGEILLGDVIIAEEVAEKQAKEFGHSFEREILYLFCHSILHLIGYDHIKSDEKKVMRLREEAIMAKIGLSR